jgi:TP901 family phage tail tape measure protein
MSVKLTEWRLKMTENVGAVLSKLNSAADATSNKMGSAQRRFNSFSSELPVVNRAIDLLSNPLVLMGAGVAATGALMYKSAGLAMDYEEAMAKVNATAQLTPPELAKLKAELMDIGENSAGNFMRIPDAFEKINSQVNNVSSSLDILKVANKGAQAGFVDIDLAAGALAQTLSIVGKRDSAQGIMDMMLKAKGVGAGEFQDFARYLPTLIASGDNLNIGHKDVAGLFSYMTAKGQSASDSAMFLQNAFTAMGKADIQEGFKEKGISFFDKEGNMRDLADVFAELQKKLGTLTAHGKSNWLESTGLRDTQARNAFSILANDAEKLRDIMAQVRDNAGEMNAQLDKTDNRTRSWAEIGDQIKSGMVGLGDFILPIVDKILLGASAWKTYLTGDKDKNEVDKWNIDDKLAQTWAMNKVKEQFPQYGPAMFENNGAKLEGKAKNVYTEAYNWDIAKLTGTMFGGDYDQWKKDEQAKALLGKSPEEKKKDFNPDKNKKKNIKEGIDGIGSGGQRVINIQFGKLNENIIIQPQTLKEGVSEVVNISEEMLVRIIQGAEVSVANE